MTDLWSMAERQAVTDLLRAQVSPLRDAMAKLFAAKRAEMQANCAASMGSVPRQLERAADFAAKAEAYAAVMDELEREVLR